MPFFAKNLTETSTLLFKGGFVEIKPGQTVQVIERDARWGVFREAVASGKVELYEAAEPRESNPSSHEVTFVAAEVVPEVVQGILEVNAVHVEPEIVAIQHTQVFVPVVVTQAEVPAEVVIDMVSETIVIPAEVVEAVQIEEEVKVPETIVEEIVPTTPVAPVEDAPKVTRKYTKK